MDDLPPSDLTPDSGPEELVPGTAPSGSAAGEAPAGAATPLADPAPLLWMNNALQILTTAAWFVAAPFIPLYLTSQGAPVDVIGAIIGLSAVVPLLISLHAGALVDERGPAAVTKASVLLYALAGVILTVLHAVPATAVAYALLGIANIGFAVASQAVVAAASTPATRVQNYGYYSLWNSAGAVVGPMVGGFITGRFGYRTAFALVCLLMIPSFAIAGALSGVPPGARRAPSLATAHRTIGSILRQRGVGAILFISFVVVCGQTLQQSFYPLYLHKVGLSPALIGIIIATISLGSMIVRASLSRGVEWFGYSWLLVGATAVLALALGIIPLLRQFWPLTAVSGLMGASLGLTQPLTMSLMIESVSAEAWGAAFGIRQAAQRIGTILSPIAFGLITTASGVEAAFFLGGAALLGTVPVMAGLTGHLRRGRQHADAPASGPPRGPNVTRSRPNPGSTGSAPAPPHSNGTPRAK